MLDRYYVLKLVCVEWRFEASLRFCDDVDILIFSKAFSSRGSDRPPPKKKKKEINE